MLEQSISFITQNGYIVFHREYVEDSAMIGQWCRDNDVVLAGRYGRWVYSAMEDAVLDGMQAAELVRGLSVPVVGA